MGIASKSISQANVEGEHPAPDGDVWNIREYYLNDQPYPLEYLEAHLQAQYTVPTIALYELYTVALRSDIASETITTISTALEWDRAGSGRRSRYLRSGQRPCRITRLG